MVRVKLTADGELLYRGPRSGVIVSEELFFSVVRWDKRKRLSCVFNLYLETA